MPFLPRPDAALPPPDDMLVARLRADDAGAFDELVVAHYEGLLRFAVYYLDTRESAEEVVQDVLLNVWRHRATLTVPAGVRIYLYGATRNRVLNHLRHRRIERRFGERAAGGEAETLALFPRPEATDERVHTAELDDAIREAIDRLPPRCREAFVLSRQHHMTHEEIAGVMGTSVRTVQEQVGRALKTLRHALADWLE